ncbi:hypothetical protein GCM10007916_34970 [Psychromonas marina]|uniref:Uncharacterized protein n=1 Tax=Psychromonas marina TaxID=88364 RepID=A0ABQ6E4W7_9GAMM|nr:hypothetical protein [Psychromonas marina]GLS92426.1 hypothetical protein GCM10007916_34970 [Psychromonas marina]
MMNTIRLLLTGALFMLLTGCPLEGDDGNIGIGGINCWDLNEDGINDANEDVSGDGLWNTVDCSAKLAPAQNPDVVFNHQDFCEAFANLGQYPSGCPSATHNIPTGTLTELESGISFFDDGTGGVASCNNSPYNGILSIKPEGNDYKWVLEGGFIAHKSIISTIDELTNKACFNSCDTDPDCIATYAKAGYEPGVDIYTCHKFYHSDTINHWEHYCGTSKSECIHASSTDQRWNVICP